MARSTSHRPFRSRAPQMETLEDRTAPAGLVGDLVVFGDSLSDTGNAALATGGTIPGPLYFNGRFSGGPIWVDTLAEYLGEPAVRPSLLPGGLDFAFGGATLAFTNPSPPFNAVPKVGQQVGLYLSGHTPSASDLFTFLAGANDFFFSSPSGAPISPDQPATALGDAIETLILAGGRQFVVGDLPALGQTPYFLDLVEAGFIPPQVAGQASQWSAGFNFFLGLKLAQLHQTYPNVTFLNADLAGLLQQAAQPNNPFGFTNWTDAVGPYDPGSGFLTGITAANPEKFLFYDSVHPGTVAQQVLGLRAAAGVYSALGINTLTVSSTSGATNPFDGTLSLREMLALANTMPGQQTITFQLGTGLQEIRLGGQQLDVTDNVVIAGPQLGPLVLNGQGTSRLFAVAGGVQADLSSMVLQYGMASQGGAILNAGNLTLRAMTLANNQAQGGSGAGMGGAIFNTGTLTARQVTFQNNTAAGATAAGGAIASSGAGASMDLSDVYLIMNRAVGGTLAQGGGVANLAGASLLLKNGTIVSNQARGGDAQGGAIYNGAAATLDLQQSLLVGNAALGGPVLGTGAIGKGQGGGVYLAAGSTFRRQQTTITANFATMAGGDLFQAP